jgi:spore maturation protein CgeB
MDNIIYKCLYERTQYIRDRGNTVVKVLRYKSEGRWFDPRWCHGIFHWHKSFWSHYDTGVDSASNRNVHQEYFLGVNAAGA